MWFFVITTNNYLVENYVCDWLNSGDAIVQVDYIIHLLVTSMYTGEWELEFHFYLQRLHIIMTSCIAADVISPLAILLEPLHAQQFYSYIYTCM